MEAVELALPAASRVPTSARYGRKMALARLPVMPLRMKMMAMRCQPASFSRSRRMVIWKITDTRQCTTLGGDTPGISPPPRLPASDFGSSGVWQVVPAAPWPRGPSSGSPGGRAPQGSGWWAARHLLPSVEEQRQPEPVELIWDLRIEEGQQPTHLVQAVHLGVRARQSAPRIPLGPRPRCRGQDQIPAAGEHTGCCTWLIAPRAPPDPTSPGSRAWPLRGNSRARTRSIPEW